MINCVCASRARTDTTPVDLKSNDIAHWQTTLVTIDAAKLEKHLQRGKAAFVSPGLVETDGQLGFMKGFLVQDPEGHAMRVVEGIRRGETGVTTK